VDKEHFEAGGTAAEEKEACGDLGHGGIVAAGQAEEFAVVFWYTVSMVTATATPSEPDSIRPAQQVLTVIHTSIKLDGPDTC